MRKNQAMRLLALVLAFWLCLAPVGAEETAVGEAAGISLNLPCKSAILIEQTTGQVLYEQDADLPTSPASITKIMTLLLFFEAMEQGKFTYESELVCSDHASSMGGSQIWLEPGEVMTVDEILRATFISSANDAAVVLAEAVAGSEDVFVQMMNDKCKELGMQNTHFQNATGLDAPEHYSTARDIAVMSAALLRYPDVIKYTTVWMDSLRGGATELVNTNKMVRFYSGATGLKTGTTSGAGSCLSASATREGLSLVAVTMGSDTSEQRFFSARTLLDYGFATFITATPPPLENMAKTLPVLHGTKREVALLYELPEHFVLRKGEQELLTGELHLPENVAAPVEKDELLGTVIVKKAEEILGEYPVRAQEMVEKISFAKSIEIFFGALVGKGSGF